jgi:oligosaccharyl transferase complex subunit OST4
MISDDQLYTLAIFLGSAAMLLIVVYHFLEVNARDLPAMNQAKADTLPISQRGNKAAQR